jgi:PAS domain S-box-containing protein
MPDTPDHEAASVSDDEDGSGCAMALIDELLTTDSNRYAGLLQAMGDAVIIIDARHQIIEFNAEAQRVFGYEKTEVLGKSINVLLPEGSRRAHDRNIAAFAIEPGDRRLMRERAEVNGRRKDGAEFDAEISIAKIGSGSRLQFLAVVRDVSARKRLERALRESTHHLWQSQQLAGLGSLEMDILTGRVTWSAQMYEILGLEPDTQPLNRELFMAKVHPDDSALILKLYNEAAANRTAVLSADLRIMRTDGTERVLQGISEFSWGEEGQLLRIVAALLDVTEQRTVATQLRLSRERLKRAQELTNLGSWEWKPHTDQMFWSDQLYRLLGVEPGSILPSRANFRSFIHPDDRTRYESCNFVPLTRTVASGVTPTEGYEFRIVRRDGAERWAHARLQPILGPAGHVVSFEGTVQDVTEQKRAADNLARSERMLEDAERIASSGSWEVDTITGDAQWSAGLYALTGLDPMRHKPDFPLFLSVVHPDDRSMMERLVEAALAGDDGQPSADYRIVSPDGTEKIVQAEARFVRDAAQRVVRVVGTNQDVTKVRTAEKKLQAALATAQAANNAKSEFLANMSHELRTPLNAIIGFSEMLASESLAPSLSDRDRGYAADIHESGQHLLEIISDILDFSRVEAGQTDTHDELIDTRSLLDWVVRLLEEKARAKNLRLVVEVMPNATSFRGDLRLLRQTLLNIVSNAVKFTVVGEIRFLATRDDKGALAISVADTGIGMRPEDIPVALTPFLQLESSLQRHYDGIGLGLSLAKRFVELHGGMFSIASELQKGTTVTIELPG